MGIGWCRGFEVWIKKRGVDRKDKMCAWCQFVSSVLYILRRERLGVWMEVGAFFFFFFFLTNVLVCLLLSWLPPVVLVRYTATAATTAVQRLLWMMGSGRLALARGRGGCVGLRGQEGFGAGRRMGGQGWHGGWFLRLRSIARESWWSHGPRSRDIASYCFTGSVAFSKTTY